MLNACSISKEIHENFFIDLGIYNFLQQDSLISNAKNQYFEIFHHSLACTIGPKRTFPPIYMYFNKNMSIWA